MATTADQSAPSPKIYKMHGTLVAVDLSGGTVVIRPSGHSWKRPRRLMVRSETEIVAGGEPRALPDLIIGEWVHAHYTKEGDRAVLKSLQAPRGIVSGHPG